MPRGVRSALGTSAPHVRVALGIDRSMHFTLARPTAPWCPPTTLAPQIRTQPPSRAHISRTCAPPRRPARVAHSQRRDRLEVGSPRHCTCAPLAHHTGPARQARPLPRRALRGGRAERRGFRVDWRAHTRRRKRARTRRRPRANTCARAPARSSASRPPELRSSGGAALGSRTTIHARARRGAAHKPAAGDVRCGIERGSGPKALDKLPPEVRR